ncbi:MAG: hypothetical protein JEZ09_00910 [Salinivirgaceae bacterium]|nr:hypothetical protein [Salinivirgaceae bacterium]
MKPVKILLFLFSILFSALCIAYVFPEEGIVIGSNYTLKFHWDFSKINASEVSYVDISQIIKNTESTIILDSIADDQTDMIDTIRAVATQLNKKIQKIEFPAGDSSILQAFFVKLNNSKNKRVRILHFGDSQIEGDRITGYMRNKFQRRFGGSGPGLMPVVPGHAESASIIHSASKNWIKHAVYFKSDTILPHRKFGIIGSYARFTTYQNDTLCTDTTTSKAWIEFSESGMAFKSVLNFTEVNVYYGHSNELFTAKGYVNDSLIWFEMLDSIQNTTSFKWNLEYAPSTFKIEFEGTKSPDVYGISLDAPTGVSVDNLPFRGSSGTEFTKIDYTQLCEMTKDMNSGLVIIQFGVNVVPYKVKNFVFYERAMARQLKYLKAILKNTPILVVGVSDMSEKKGNYFESYQNVEEIIQAQRNAALSANCAYWDLYTAMGGKNSMPSWVFAEPPLANKDFIHFNRRGGHIVSQMIYNALMREYEKYNASIANKKQIKLAS